MQVKCSIVSIGVLTLCLQSRSIENSPPQNTAWCEEGWRSAKGVVGVKQIAEAFRSQVMKTFIGEGNFKCHVGDLLPRFYE